ncbi:hypothetical protein HYH02_005505 [Chlamydomonas schloesseri]|uniref:RRM domain-containing protein n=1 Tax=Chlamydomonas schloesseri TaxID=2026947 RepID=A0A835WKX4_9CHLO|nr:hypothetical protein HYH02_005505 [Chlamydomonas schloesseri]|eukprot:KAG2449350.1 hypothetical protein HYH02_005505 [Chlamydomonas schloesseri]
MAEVKLAMSLDELIAQAGKKREKKAPAAKPAKAREGGAPATGARKGLKKNRQDNGAKANGQQQQQQPKQRQAQPQQQPTRQQQQGGQRNRQPKANLGVRQGQVQKRSQVIEVPARVLRQQAPQAPAPRANRAPYRTQPAPEDGKWQHDMYEDHGPAPRRAPVSQAATSTKLVIRNLHHGVSSDDVLELFSTCGSVKNHSVNFDASGRSVGTGFVVFETRAEAVAAKKEYNGVKLDGQAMEILFAEEAAGGAGGGVQRLSSGIHVQRPGAGERAGGSGSQRLAAAALRESAAPGGPRSGGRPAGGRGGRLRSAVVGRAALDRSLDDYMME